MYLLNFAINSHTIRDYTVPWFMYVAVIFVLVVYAIIEAYHTRKDHEVKFVEAAKWSAFYITLALLFTIPVYIFIGSQAAGEYLAAWVIEKALSLDNLFVIGLIFSSFNVPKKLERRMLNYGIAGAIIFRLVFIIAGLELLKRFEWISIVFGIILLRAAWKALQEARGKKAIEHDLAITDKRLWKTMTKIFPLYTDFDGHKLIKKIDGRHMLTLMGGIIILIEFTDIIFAVDSVPAVLAVSPNRFIAYSSNIFALLGLRALFFVYQSLTPRFWALPWALSGILGWISFKLIAAPLGLHVPIAISLGILGALLGGSIFASIIWKHRVQPGTVKIIND